MIEEPITKFYVFQSDNARQVVVAILINDIIFQCWYANNNETQILSAAKRLLTAPSSGWLATQTDLSKHIATYTIHSHPEYFL